jgi:hypothetical protein
MTWKINDAAVDAFIAGDRAHAAAVDSHLEQSRCCIAAGLRAAVPHVIAERVDAAGEDEGAFTDWWMAMYEEAGRTDA